MLYTIQTYLEDYLRRLSYQYTDNFAVEIAKIYYAKRIELDDEELIKIINEIKTSFYVNNRIENREEINRLIISRLDSRFKKKLSEPEDDFSKGLDDDKIAYGGMVPSMDIILDKFRNAVEARGIDSFWVSRKKNELKKGPESIAQGLWGTYTYRAFEDQVVSIREFLSGIGFVDSGIVINGKLDLIEIKILDNGFTGVEQLDTYMKTEGIDRGYLLVFDARSLDRKSTLPVEIPTEAGKVYVKVVNINPQAPSKK